MAVDDNWQLPPISAGTLTVMLAKGPLDLENSQRLRYNIYFDEMGGDPSPEAKQAQRDFDEFDDVCDHLLVVDNSLIGEQNPVVGTYRILRSTPAAAFGRFYSESEFDISHLKSTGSEIMELGRSCVRADYRSRATMQLLWRGIGAYMMHHQIQYLFGCASFMGLEVEPLKPALSFLYHNRLAPENIRPKALDDLYVKMDWLDKEACNSPKVIASMPPLIKGYLKLGCFVGDGAVKDPKANTTDVSIILPINALTDKYFERYAASHIEK
jgi:putative hemolysin